MFAHNHTEAGEAKGGAAAAAAEVNKYLITSAHLHHIPDISARFLTHIPNDVTALLEVNDQRSTGALHAVVPL